MKKSKYKSMKGGKSTKYKSMRGGRKASTPQTFNEIVKKKIDVAKVMTEVIGELAFEPLQKAVAKKVGKKDAKSFQELTKKKAGGRL